VPYLIYAYDVPEINFKRWRKSARGGVTKIVIEDTLVDPLLPGNVIEDRNAAREYYNARYFYVQQKVEAAKVNTVHLSREKVYARRVKYGQEYDAKVAEGHDMREYENRKSGNCA
jgi:hypothetical protein